MASWPNPTRPDPLDLTIGDASGKGIGAALLLPANLQAKLRSQSAIALDDPEILPEILLRSVNRMFHENTVDGAFASLFYAV